MRIEEIDPKKTYVAINDRPQAILSTEEKKEETDYPPSGLYMAAALLVIFFAGEPDLVDALIAFLTK